MSGNPGDRREVPRFLHATEPKEKLVNVPSVPIFPRHVFSNQRSPLLVVCLYQSPVPCLRSAANLLRLE